MNKSYKADVYTMGLKKSHANTSLNSHTSVSGVIVWYKEELEKKRKKESERERPVV